MKNLHKLVLGLMVGAMAISFSAFTNAHSNHIIRPNNYIAQTTLNGFVPESSAPVTDDCSGTATLQCAYDVTSSGKSNIPNQASYTSAEINTYVANDWLTPAPGSSKALYQP